MSLSRGYLRVFRNSILKCIRDVAEARPSEPSSLSAVGAELSCMLLVLDREEPSLKAN